MPARGVRLLVALAIAWAALPTLPANAAPLATHGLEIQLLDAPKAAENDPRAHIYIIDQVTPGTLVTRHVRVSNTSDSDGAVSMYTAGASVSGGKYLFDDGRAKNDLATWTSLSTGHATLPAGKSTELTVIIAIPRDATGGERYAVIWAERASPPTAGRSREVNRVGIRIYLDVNSSKVEQPSNFAINTVTADRDGSGRPHLTAAVSNTGARTIDVSGTVGLTKGPGGVSVAPIAIAAPVTIAPGDTQLVQAFFDPQLAAGPWQAEVDLTSGLVHRRATATVSFTAKPVAAAATAAPTDAGSSRTGEIMWIGAAIVVAALAVLIWVALRRRAAQPVNG